MTARQGLAILIRTVRIRYSRAPAILILVCVAVIVALACVDIVFGKWSIPDLGLNLVAAVVFSVIGIGLVVRPLGELTDTELIVRAQFGRRVWRYPADQLRLLEGRIYSGDRRLRILDRWSTNRDDWRALVERLQARGG